MAPAVKQVFSNGGFAASITASSGANITSGNVLIACQYTNSTTGVASNPSGCVTWTQAATNNTIFEGGGVATGTWSVGPITATGACTVTANGNGGSVGLMIGIWEVSGVLTTVDGTPGFKFASVGGAETGPSTTTTTSGDIVLAINFFDNTPVTSNSPFTSNANGALFPGGTRSNGDMAYYVQTVAGAINDNYTLTSATMDMSIIALKASGVVGGSSSSWLTVNLANSLRGLRH